MDPDPITFCDPVPPLHLAARLALRLRLWHERRRWMREMRAAAALSRLDDVLNDVELDPRRTRRSWSTVRPMPDGSWRPWPRWPGSICAVATRRPCARPPGNAPAATTARRASAWLRDGIWRGGGGDTRCPNAGLLLQD